MPTSQLGIALYLRWRCDSSCAGIPPMFDLLKGSLFPSRLSGYATGWLGIDFGSTTLKFVQLRKRRNQFECLQDTWIETPSLDNDTKLPLRAIKETPPPAAIVITNRWIEIEYEPKIPADSQSASRASMQEYGSSGCALLIPDPEFQAAIQPKKLQAHPGMLSWLGDQIIRAGIEPRVIDATPWTLARALTLLDRNEEQSVSAILDWSANSPMLVIQRKGLPQFCRSLETGGLIKIVEGVSERLQLPSAETIYYLKHLENSHKTSETNATSGKRQYDWTSSLLTPPISHLAEDISKSLHFLKIQCPKLLPTKLFLCGGGATLPCLVEQLQSQIDIPIVPWSLPTIDGHTLGPASAQAAALSALGWMP